MKYNKYTSFARAKGKVWILEKAKSYQDAVTKSNELFRNTQYDYSGIALNIKNDIIAGFKTDKIIILQKR